jgi:hypothetical protein
LRVIECNLCGHTLSAATDDELVDAVRRHMEEQHPDEAAGDAEVRELVAAQAYEASDS